MKNHVFVGGGSKGLGLATAIKFASQDFNIVLGGSNITNLELAKKTIQSAYNVDVILIKVDFYSKDDVENLIKKLSNIEYLRVIVNNHGGPKPGGVELTPEDFDDGYNSLLRTTISLVQFFKEYSNKNNFTGSSFISILGVVSKEPSEYLTISSTFRAAISAYSKAISKRLISDFNIRINCVSPGAFLTDRARSLIDKEGIELDDEIKKRGKKIPLGRFQEPWELAELIYFLSSDSGASIIGQNIVIDGGISNSI